MKKKMLAALAASVMLCGVLSAPASAAAYKKGDINMDGEITAADAQLALIDYTEYLVAGMDHILTEEQLELGNIDGKFKETTDEMGTRISGVTAREAQAILYYYTACVADSGLKEVEIVDYLAEYYPNYVQ
ncbi:MAG: hypothetical protein IKI77_00940 [Oscillospiraceae bacterium]|nr:hypothetical protein [Oscillospiraceae bacterium]